MGKRVILTEEQFKGYIKYLLNEGMSDKLFHFTTIKALQTIVNNNQFILSSSLYSNTEHKIGNGYPFYMSFTREFSNKLGYSKYKQAQETNLINQLNVRIEINGQALSSNYKGGPVNYHNYDVVNNKQQQNANGDDLKLVEIRQSEDRLFSKRPIINNVDKYITRIDILVPTDIFARKNTNYTNILARLIRSNIFGNRIFLYNNVESFNYYHSNDFINDKIINFYSNNQKMLNRINNTDQYNDNFSNNYSLGRGNGRVLKEQLSLKQCRCVGRLLKLAAFIANTNNYNKLVEMSLNGYNNGKTYYEKAYNQILLCMNKTNIHDQEYLKNVYDDLRHFSLNFHEDLKIIFGNVSQILYICKNKSTIPNIQNLNLRNIITLIRKNKL